MSVPATGLDLTLELALQDDVATPCENAFHGERPHEHGGPAEWYVKVLHDCPSYPEMTGEVRAYCDPFAQFLIREPSKMIRCADCQRLLQLRDFFQVLGPMRP
jgi:hypothetical protein